MAYFRKLKTGWRAEVERQGVRQSQMFRTKTEATLWASEVEKQILTEKKDPVVSKTVADALDRYASDVSSKKRGAKQELNRITATLREHADLCGMLMRDVRPEHIAAWRDKQGKTVAPASVARYANLLRNVWSVAAKEWGWIKESPWKSVKLPTDKIGRTRLTTWREVRAIVRHLGYMTGKPPASQMAEVAWAYLLAQHTAMRAGELLGLSVGAVGLGKRVVTLHSHKTVEREGVRFVPVSRRAARLLTVLVNAAKAADREALFTVSSQSLDVLFRRARDRLLIRDLHFHDSRADALTRMARKVDVMTLARVSGHRDLKILLQRYYRETAADIAARL